MKNWGGARPGAGRKPAYMLTENRVKAMLRRMRKAKKELGIDEDDFLVTIITEGRPPEADPGSEDTASIRDRLAAVKMFKEFTMTKQSEQNINVNQGPVIGLPESKPDPSKIKVIEGGKSN